MRTVRNSSHALTLLICLVIFGNWVAAQQPPSDHPLAKLYLDNQTHLPTVDSALNRAQARLSELINWRLAYKPDLYVVGDLDRFTELIGGKFPDWGAAAAIPSRQRIVIKSPDRFQVQRSLPELVAHEYSHLVLADRMGIREAPRWLDEGMAMYVSAEWGWTDNLAMSKAAVFRQFVKLSEIDRVNRFNAGKAGVAYSQSFLAVKYLVDQYGVGPLNLLLDNLAAGQPMDTALMRSTGALEVEFESEFQGYLAKRYNVTSLFMDTIWLWIFLAFVVIVGGFIKFRRRREYYRKWEEQEKLESTEFDYGPGKAEESDPDEDDEPWRR